MLEARVKPGLLGIGRGVAVLARCTRSGGPVATPEIGCGLCHAPLDLPLTPGDPA
jgi:hypothetical protein